MNEKTTKSNQEILTQANKRINIIKGQLEGLKKMIEKDEYCIDLLTQSSAIQNSIKSLDALILERHLRTHVSHQFKTEPEKAVGELLRVFKQSLKNK